MSWDTVPGRNGEGYPDPTASTALARVQHSQKGLQSKRAGEHFENMITASLNWYCDKGVAFVEKTPEPMKPLRKPDRQGRFLACYTKAGQPDFKGTLTGGRAVVFETKHTDSDKIDQSIAHNGVCLTVVDLTEDTYTVTAMKETLLRSNLGALQVGDLVNVERSMKPDALLDGHIVQGHVDQTAECMDIKDAEGSWYFTFRYAFDKEMAKRGYITVDKGSVTVNGVSLTVCNPTEDTFQVAIIPYTYEHTNFHTFKVGSIVNIEFDIIGKYLSRMMQFS